jgi:hypothetical protein
VQVGENCSRDVLEKDAIIILFSDFAMSARVVIIYVEIVLTVRDRCSLLSFHSSGI